MPATEQNSINLLTKYKGVTLQEVITHALYMLYGRYSYYKDYEGPASNNYNPIFAWSCGTLDPHKPTPMQVREYYDADYDDSTKKQYNWKNWPEFSGIERVKHYIQTAVLPFHSNADYFTSKIVKEVPKGTTHENNLNLKASNRAIKDKIMFENLYYTKEDIGDNEIILSIIFVKQKQIKRIHITNLWSVCASLTDDEHSFYRVNHEAKELRPLVELDSCIEDGSTIPISDENVREVFKQLQITI